MVLTPTPVITPAPAIVAGRHDRARHRHPQRPAAGAARRQARRLALGSDVASRIRTPAATASLTFQFGVVRRRRPVACGSPSTASKAGSLDRSKVRPVVRPLADRRRCRHEHRHDHRRSLPMTRGTGSPPLLAGVRRGSARCSSTTARERHRRAPGAGTDAGPVDLVAAAARSLGLRARPGAAAARPSSSTARWRPWSPTHSRATTDPRSRWPWRLLPDPHWDALCAGAAPAPVAAGRARRRADAGDPAGGTRRASAPHRDRPDRRRPARRPRRGTPTDPVALHRATADRDRRAMPWPPPLPWTAGCWCG